MNFRITPTFSLFFLGIGSEIVKELSNRGGHVIMCCRNVENGEKVKRQIMKHVPKARIDIRHLDLRSFDNVRQLVKSIGEDDFNYSNHPFNAN